MRKRLWLAGFLVMFCGLPLLFARGAAQRAGWAACYTVAELERFPEARFFAPATTVVRYQTRDETRGSSYHWFGSLYWELRSPKDAATVVQAYRDYLPTQGWTQRIDRFPDQLTWYKGRLYIDLSILDPGDYAADDPQGLYADQTWYSVLLLETDSAKPCFPAVPPIAD